MPNVKISYEPPTGPPLHVTGAYGGLTARGEVHMALWTEETTLPVPEIFPLSADGHMLNADRLRPRGISIDLTRRIVADLFFNIDVAIELRDWLTDKINAAEQQRPAAAKRAGT